MKKTKFIVIFLTAAAALSILLAACFSEWMGEDIEGGYGSVTFSLAGTNPSRQLVGLASGGMPSSETHTYELIIASKTIPLTPDTTTSPATLTGDGVPAGNGQSFEIRAYIGGGDLSNVFSTTTPPLPSSLENRDYILRAIGTGTADIKAGVMNNISSGAIVLYSAMDVSSWEELVWAAAPDSSAGSRKEIIILKAGTYTVTNTTGTITINRNIELRAEGGVVTIIRDPAFNGTGTPNAYFFDINTGSAELYMGFDQATGKSVGYGITLDGGGSTITPNGPLIHNTGVCTIGSGVTLMNNYSTGTSGAMPGGVLNSGGTFTLYGKIKGNSSTLTGNNGAAGGVSLSGGTFNMEAGASIEDNTSDGSGGGVEIPTSALSSATFNINGGTIKNNTASVNGGGVFIGNGSFTMTGGSIADNQASSGYGGGVYVSVGTFEISNSINNLIGENVVSGNNSSLSPPEDNVYLDQAGGTIIVNGTTYGPPGGPQW
jgi:hypothetical protein